MIALPVLEDITDRSGVAPRIELLLPIGVRARQLAVRTLLLGMLLVQADHRPAHLTRVHQALTTLPEDDQRRLGVLPGVRRCRRFGRWGCRWPEITTPRRWVRRGLVVVSAGGGRQGAGVSRRPR